MSISYLYVTTKCNTLKFITVFSFNRYGPSNVTVISTVLLSATSVDVFFAVFRRIAFLLRIGEVRVVQLSDYRRRAIP